MAKYNMKTVVGVEGITFDSANYTPGSTSKCRRLHGHTFRVDVEVEGNIDPNTGMVIDFLEIKKLVKEVVEKYDHKVILPEKDRGNTILKGKFETEIQYINKPHATTEYIAQQIAEELADRLLARENLWKIKVKLYEGRDKYAEIVLSRD